MKRLNEKYDAFLPSSETFLDDYEAVGLWIHGPPLITNPSDPWRLLFTRSRTNQFMDTQFSLNTPDDLFFKPWIQCSKNVHRLTLALLLYEKDHGTLPEGDWRKTKRRMQ